MSDPSAPAAIESAEDAARRNERSKSFADKARAFRRRTVQKVMVAVGKADSSVDEEFEELTKKFYALDKNLQDVQRDLKLYIEAKRSMLSMGASVAEGILPIFDRQAPLRHVAVQFKDLQVFMETSVKPQVDTAFLEQVMEPLQKQLKHFEEVKLRIEKRSRLLLDYDSYRRKVKAIAEKANDKKLAEKEKKLGEASKRFNELNERLLEELQLVDENKSIVLQRPLVELLKIQHSFYSKAFDEFKKVSSILSDPSVERTIKEGEEFHSEAYAALGARSLDDFLSGAPMSVPAATSPAAASISPAAAAAATSMALTATSGGNKSLIDLDDMPVQATKVVAAAPSVAAKLGGTNTTAAATNVTPVKIATTAAAAATTINNNNSNNNAAKAKPPPPTKPQAKCKALYQYDATADTELSMLEGDVITVLKQDDSGWWQGQLAGKTGWFPCNYVKLIEN